MLTCAVLRANDQFVILRSLEDYGEISSMNRAVISHTDVQFDIRLSCYGYSVSTCKKSIFTVSCRYRSV